jgi:hypothetical protein
MGLFLTVGLFVTVGLFLTVGLFVTMGLFLTVGLFVTVALFLTVFLLLIAGLFLTEGIPDNRTGPFKTKFCITLSARAVSGVEEQSVATALSYSDLSFWIALDVSYKCTVLANCSSSLEHWKDSGKSMYHPDYVRNRLFTCFVSFFSHQQLLMGTVSTSLSL